MCSLICFQKYQLCPNWNRNINMVNKDKKRDTEFWSDFKTKNLKKPHVVAIKDGANNSISNTK